MNEPSNDDCIAIRVIDKSHGKLDGITSVFIKREGRDPTLQDLIREAERARRAEREEFEILGDYLHAENDIQPLMIEVFEELQRQQQNPEFDCEFTLYRHWDEDPVWPTNSKVPTSRTNPVDLTRSDQSATNALTTKQRTDLRQTNAESVRSSPSISTRTSCLNINTPAKQGPVSERAQSHPGVFLSEADRQSDLTTQMSDPRLSKIKAVAKRPATSMPNTGDVSTRPIAEATAKIATKGSSQPPTDQHAESPLERFANNVDGRRALQSKGSPPPAKFRKVFDQSSSAEGSPQTVSSTDKRQIPAQPSFVKQHKNTSLLFDNYESPDKMARSAQSLLSGTPIIGKPVFKRAGPQPSPAPGKLSVQQPVQQPAKQPAAAPTTQQNVHSGTPEVSSSQCKSTQVSFLWPGC
jgi:hypothetical protein